MAEMKLDEKGMEAARVAYEAQFPDAAYVTFDGMEAAIRAYLLASPPSSREGVRVSSETIQALAEELAREDIAALLPEFDAIARATAGPIIEIKRQLIERILSALTSPAPADTTNTPKGADADV